MKKNPRVAIVCDWLTGVGGAERVVFEIHKMFPDAPIFTSQYDPAKIDWFDDADVRTGWLQHLPPGLKKFLPILRGRYFSRLDLSEFDLIISASGAEAKFVQVEKPAIHVAYIHSPTHYYWSRYDEYIEHPGFGKFDWLARVGLKSLVGPLRKKDYTVAQRPDYLIANSTHTQAEIKKYYSRDSVVIFPPVELDRFKHPRVRERHGFVVTGRQTPYKKIDLAVAACTKLNLPLTVIGNGPDHEKLVKLAGPTIEFITNASDKDVANFLAGAEAYIFPTNAEDFGIAPVEALASGAPVIAYKKGGPIDYIKPGINGEFFDELNVASIVNTLKKFRPGDYKTAAIRSSSSRFSVAQFHRDLANFLVGIK